MLPSRVDRSSVRPKKMALASLFPGCIASRMVPARIPTTGVRWQHPPGERQMRLINFHFLSAGIFYDRTLWENPGAVVRETKT
jgi:hypothetical protein